MGIKDKVVIVTGASSGIGMATARIFTDNGAKVALVARSKDKLIRLSHELKGSFSCPTDITEHTQIKKMVHDVMKHYGCIDILINNAGQGYDALIENTNIDEFQHIIDLDLIGPLYVMQQVIPIMKKQGSGSIINISSGTALMHLVGMGGYAAIKSALSHLSLTAREELRPYKINVSIVYPYITDTNFEKNTIKDKSIDSKDDIGGSNEPQSADSPEYIAQKIIDCCKSEAAEIFAHDWMKDI